MIWSRLRESDWLIFDYSARRQRGSPRRGIAEQWAARIPAPTYAIDDQTAIK